MLKSTIKQVTSLVACLFVALFGICQLYGQSTTGTILGQVTDPSGAVLSDVIVTVTNTLTNESHAIATNSQGQYVIPHLPVGIYRVESQAKGFKHIVHDGVTLTVNQEARIDLILQLGQTTDSVEIHADAAQVNTYTADLGTLVDSQRVVDLPLNGRNVYALLTTIPGVSSISNNTVAARSSDTFQLNGGRSTTNSCLLDGGFNNDIWRNTCATPPNPDAVQEFRVLASNSDVEFGRMPGAFVNIITKSGSNSYHGSAYEFLRNDALDARNYFDSKVTPLKQNQYGFTVGGPVIKNKLFLFGSYEGLKRRTSSLESSIAVPTLKERTGDFSSATTKPIDPLTGLEFPNDVIPTSRLDTVALAIIDQSVPKPNDTNGTYSITASAPANQWQYLLKGDYQLTGQQKFTVSWFQLNTFNHDPFPYFNQMAGYSEMDASVYQKNLVVNHTWTATNNFYNESRFNLMRRTTPSDLTSSKTLGDYGSSYNQGSSMSVPPRINVSGRFKGGGWASRGLDHSIGGSDTITWIKGKHNIKIGSSMMWGYYSEVGASAGGGAIYDASSDYTGNALANFMLGYSTTFNEDSGDNPDVSSKYWHSYAQDTWQITPRITFTAGLRYELTTPLVWTKNYIGSFEEGVQSTVYTNAPTGLLFYGDKGVKRAGRKTDFNNFAPRIGIAIDPFGNGKTSVRAGYGLYYLAAYGDGIRAPQPFILSVEIDGDTSLVNPWVNYSGGDPFPYTVPTSKSTTFYTPMSAIHFSSEAATPFVNQMNLAVQQQLTKNLNLQVAYVGTLGRKQSINIDQNAAVYAAGSSTSSNVDKRRPYMPGTWQQITNYETAANSSYHGLQILANQRLAHGVSFNANYTYAKSLDLVSSDQYNESISVTDSSNIGRDRGPTSGMARNIFSFSGVWETPKVTKLNAVVNRVLSGWQANAIVTLHSGTPFNVTSGVDSNFDNNWNDRPNLVGNPYLSSGRSRADKIAKYFNYGAFEAAADGQYGNVERDFMTGPGYFNTDLSFFRLFNVYKTHSIQFRAELFNAFNHTNLENPDSGLKDSNVGKITSSYDPRIVQFGLRYSF